MSRTVLCRVCGVRVVSVRLWCSCGGVSSVRYPLAVVEGGAVVVVGGMVREGRQCYLLPVECRRPRLCVGTPPCRLSCGLIEWRGAGFVCCLVFGLGPPLHIVLALLVLSLLSSFPLPPFVFSVTALLV